MDAFFFRSRLIYVNIKLRSDCVKCLLCFLYRADSEMELSFDVPAGLLGEQVQSISTALYSSLIPFTLASHQCDGYLDVDIRHLLSHRNYGVDMSCGS
jgi:hypothetical protein